MIVGRDEDILVIALMFQTIGAEDQEDWSIHCLLNQTGPPYL